MDRRLILIVVGSLLLVTALSWPLAMGYVRRQFVLTPNSAVYKMWYDLPVPIYMDFYLYDWVNAKEFEKDSSATRPHLREIGPFVYQEYHKRVDVSWNSDGSTLSFNQTRSWKFIPEESADLTVNVTNLNPVALTVAYVSRLWENGFHREIANVLIKRYESLFVTAPAENWLFTGNTHELLELAKIMQILFGIPLPYEKFAWFYDRNNSASFDGRFEMKTGTANPFEMGDLVRWNGMNQTDFFEGECGEVKGSAGELMPPLRKHQNFISSFSPDLCSYMNLPDAGPVTVEGTDGRLFEGDESVFDNGDRYPKNLCFSVGERSPSGTRNVSACKFGTPAFVSFPHFYLADPAYTRLIDGMSPNRDDHSFRIKLDPRTGIALEVNAAIQINLLLKSYDWCETYKGKPEIYVPMLWFRQRAKISPLLSFLVRTLHFAFDYGSTVCFCLAELCFLGVGIMFLMPKRTDKISIGKPICELNSTDSVSLHEQLNNRPSLQNESLITTDERLNFPR